MGGSEGKSRQTWRRGGPEKGLGNLGQDRGPKGYEGARLMKLGKMTKSGKPESSDLLTEKNDWGRGERYFGRKAEQKRAKGIDGRRAR